jgi:flagellar basal-body rod modification protein FlgD
MIGSISAATDRSAASGGTQLGGLGTDAFLKLLVAQLRFQNPMAPSDPSAMLSQTASFTQVETLKQVAKTQQLLLGMQQAAIASGLVGKEVSALAADGSTVQGVVDGVRFTESGPILLVGDMDVPLEAATEIRGQQATTTTS